MSRFDWIRATARALFITTLSFSLGIAIALLLFMYLTYKLRITPWIYPRGWFFAVWGSVALSGVVVYLLRPKYPEEEDKECKPQGKTQTET